jgi:hypothetical protein
MLKVEIVSNPTMASRMAFFKATGTEGAQRAVKVRGPQEAFRFAYPLLGMAGSKPPLS